MSRFCCFILTGALLMVSGVVLGQGSSVPSEPPRQYRLEQVGITLLFQTPNRNVANFEIAIQGDGRASYASDKGERRELTLRNEELVELLNEFYRIHFFELQDTYTLKRQVSLLEDGTISTFVHRQVDMGSKRLCIKIADYTKCVTIVANEPPAANELAEKIRSLFVLTRP